MLDTATTVTREEIARLEDQLERSFRGGAWHGPSVTEALEGVDATAAARRPASGTHSIWELAGHLHAWTEVVRRRIQGEEIEGLTAEEDFPRADPASAGSWADLRKELEDSHRALRQTLRRLDDGDLAAPVSGSDPTVRGLLLGLLQHHAYHAGQIALLAKAAPPGRRP